MAVQSLYRRYRPRRFDELKGQEHVVRALQNAVINHREGQAYLFSGPRGTGKTSTARILAKVLNCEEPENGEPCGICNSCGAIDSGNSYDVLELDAASNNGVENMRDLIERSSLGNPGRHRVFILDEVHMLSKPAEAALLKTLEEPPPHVVFVLATTDPQKVSETIRSRTQHLQFHLLPMHDLDEHVRWVIKDANLKVSEAAIAQVLTQGGGSARDTLSALELVAAGGGEADEQLSPDEFVEAIIDRDPGRALGATAAAIQRGADPRMLAEEIVRQLRECFLSLMAPDLVQLPEQRKTLVAEQARRMGASTVVRAIEVLGEILIEMRHAPDARLLIEVALVKLTSVNNANDNSSLIARIERLEAGITRDASAPMVRPAPINAATGKVQLGGKATVAVAAPSVGPLSDEQLVSQWSDVVSGFKALARAVFSAVSAVSCVDGVLTVSAPNDAHQRKAQEHVAAVEAQLSSITGRKITVAFNAPTARPSAAAPARAKAPVATDEQIAEAVFEDVDPSQLTSAPTTKSTTTTSVEDQLAKAFPGSKLVDKPKKK
ncbi:MAG: DNA polymerase III subunit gamma/tau [Actinobacteria bacterium]|uniref:DNA-directed DNA polymerase n=1 Tax=freshwater metagenome TaxID=449393 RepID=A0A6J6WDF6_9ZZZZ|nr:DNA polymerase III subunit gamma/tau [Actinomycetota bacterium]